MPTTARLAGPSMSVRNSASPTVCAISLNAKNGTSATYTSAGVPHFASMSSMGQKRTSRIHRFGYAVKT